MDNGLQLEQELSCDPNFKNVRNAGILQDGIRKSQF